MRDATRSDWRLMSTMTSVVSGITRKSVTIFAVASISRKVPASSRMESSWRPFSCTTYSARRLIPKLSCLTLYRMIHLVNTGNNGPRCIEYRVYLINLISRFTIKLERCTTCETRSIIVLVDFKTCPSVDKQFGRLLMWPTSSSTLLMNSFILSSDPGMRERAIFILAARTTPLSVSSKLVSSKSSFSMNACISENW